MCEFEIVVDGYEAKFVKHRNGGWYYYGFFNLSASRKLGIIREVIDIIPEGYAGLDYPDLIKSMELL
jgi:hypothetical protein